MLGSNVIWAQNSSTQVGSSPSVVTSKGVVPLDKYVNPPGKVCFGEGQYRKCWDSDYAVYCSVEGALDDKCAEWWGIDLEKEEMDRKIAAEENAKREAAEARRVADERAQDRANTESTFGYPNITEYLGVNASGFDAITFDSMCYQDEQSDKNCVTWLTEKAAIQATREEAKRGRRKKEGRLHRRG